MSTENITFESDQFRYKSRVILGQAQVPEMTKFLIGKGIVKNEKQATNIMVAITILFFLSSFVIIYINFFKQSYVPTTPSEFDMYSSDKNLNNTPQ